VKKQKERVTQEDIDKEDDELITSFVQRLSPTAKNKGGTSQTPLVKAFSPRE
jgi:hypothetical protein